MFYTKPIGSCQFDFKTYFGMSGHETRATAAPTPAHPTQLILSAPLHSSPPTLGRYAVTLRLRHAGLVAARRARWRSHTCVLRRAPVAGLHAEARGEVCRAGPLAVHLAGGGRDCTLPVRAGAFHHTVPVARAVGVAVTRAVVAPDHDEIGLLTARAGQVRHWGRARADIADRDLTCRARRRRRRWRRLARVRPGVVELEHHTVRHRGPEAFSKATEVDGQHS